MNDDLGYMGKYLQAYVPEHNANMFIHSSYQEIRAFPYQTAVVVQQKQIPDVSFYDGLIDWGAMRSHTDSVIIRAGQGNWIDEYFFTNWAEAKKRGMLRGAYWFSDGRYSPGAQAGLLASLIEKDPPELFIATDWEHNYGGNYEGLPNVVAFMQRLQVLMPDVRQKFYSGYYYFIANSNPTTNASQYSYLKSIGLWLAWYTDNPSIVLIPKPWINLEFWQWGTPSWGEQWGSVKAEIDMSYFNGNIEQFYDVYGTPSSEGETGGSVTKYELLMDLNMRNAAISGSVVTTLPKGSFVWGVFDTNTNWIRVSQYQKVGGSITPLDAWCSGYGTYVKVVVDTPPSVQPKIEVKLAPGSVVTVTKADGTQEVITA